MNRRPSGIVLVIALITGVTASGGAEEHPVSPPDLGDDLVYPGTEPQKAPHPEPETAKPLPSAVLPAQGIEHQAPLIQEGQSEFDRLLNKLLAEERALEQEAESIGPTLTMVHRRMLARARAHVRHLRAGVLPAGGGFDALVDHAATVERTRLALERDRNAEAELNRRRVEIGERLAKIRAEKAPLLIQREAMARASLALKQADERQAAFARAFESSAKPPDYMAIYGSDLAGGEGQASEGFKTLRGRLPMPISGRAEARKVYKAGAGGAGLALAGMPQAAVRSVALGRVVYAEHYEPYGLTLIVDHGDGYATVYGNLGSLDVKTGDVVRPSFRVGTVGQGGELYFEIRRRAEILDPGAWLGI